MTFSISYKPLFEVNILHKYFLSIGTSDFFAMDSNTREKQLAAYRLSALFSIEPSADTRRKLLGQNMVFKTTNTGFMVWARVADDSDLSPLVPVSDDLQLTFLLKPTDPCFWNYTELDLAKYGGLFYFSNQRLSTESASFPLIKKATGEQTVSERYALNSESSRAELAQISFNERTRLFAMVRVFMKGENASLNVTTNQQKIRTSHRGFQLAFENRKTLWRYIFRGAQTVTGADDLESEDGSTTELVTKTVCPLTRNGFVSVELGGTQLPNPDIRLIKSENGSTNLYSEIYM